VRLLFDHVLSPDIRNLHETLAMNPCRAAASSAGAAWLGRFGETGCRT
jgi:hypothetical protein